MRSGLQHAVVEPALRLLSGAALFPAPACSTGAVLDGVGFVRRDACGGLGVVGQRRSAFRRAREAWKRGGVSSVAWLGPAFARRGGNDKPVRPSQADGARPVVCAASVSRACSASRIASCSASDCALERRHAELETQITLAAPMHRADQFHRAAGARRARTGSCETARFALRIAPGPARLRRASQQFACSAQRCGRMTLDRDADGQTFQRRADLVDLARFIGAIAG